MHSHKHETDPDPEVESSPTCVRASVHLEQQSLRSSSMSSSSHRDSRPRSRSHGVWQAGPRGPVRWEFEKPSPLPGGSPQLMRLSTPKTSLAGLPSASRPPSVAALSQSSFTSPSFATLDSGIPNSSPASIRSLMLGPLLGASPSPAPTRSESTQSDATWVDHAKFMQQPFYSSGTRACRSPSKTRTAGGSLAPFPLPSKFDWIDNAKVRFKIGP